MPTSTPILPPTQTTYRTAIVHRILLAVTVPLVVGGISYAGFAIWHKSHGAQTTNLALVLGLLVGIIFLLYSLVAAFKRAFIIADDRVIEQNAWPFAPKELLLREIAGFRTNDKFTTIHPTGPDLPTLKIAKSIESYDKLQFWLADHYPDLDLVEAEDTKATLLADEQLGGTPEDRANRLALAKRVGWVLNALGGIVAVWLFIRPQPYAYAIAAGVVVPLLAAGALFVFPRFMRLEAGKNSPHASVAIALLMPSLGLLTRALADGEPISYAPVWPVVGEVAAAFGVLLVAGNRHSLLEHGTLRRGSGSEWLLLLMCAAAYGFGAPLTANAAFDEKAPTLYRVQVLNKHKNSGKSTTYYLQVTPWGPRTASENVTVSSAYYEYMMPGDSATVVARPGRLGIAWFELAE